MFGYILCQIRKLFINLRHLPQTIFFILKDCFFYIKNREYKKFNKYGIQIFTSASSAFGSGKTISIVEMAYYYCKKYPELSVLTNITLSNFPEHTKIIKLSVIDDIVNCPDNCIILIDEIGALLNCRDFMHGRTISKDVFAEICQVRHRHILMLASAQYWGQVDKQLRKITTYVCPCSSYFGIFKRFINYFVFDAKEFERAYENPMLPLYPVGVYGFVASDKIRSLYNTNELVRDILKSDSISESSDSIASSVPMDKKSVRKLKKNLNRMK